MKDYRQSSSDNENNLEQNDNLESKDNDLNLNNANNNNGSLMPIENTLNESDFRKDNKINSEMNNQNRNVKMNFDYKMERILGEMIVIGLFIMKKEKGKEIWGKKIRK